MLALTRHVKDDKGVMIYDPQGRLIVTIYVVEATRGRAKLAFHADPSFKIMRGEVDDHTKANAKPLKAK